MIIKLLKNDLGDIKNMSSALIQVIGSIIVALLTGGLTLIGVIVANSKSQAVTNYRIDELTREVREHNNFAKRMPVVEEQIKVINHRLDDLEGK